MFFENVHICPNCGNKIGFYVVEPIKGEIMTYSTNYPKAKDWRIIGNEVIVTLKCDKCWNTSESRYTLNGEFIGEENGNSDK